jgi:hypothetical protein
VEDCIRTGKDCGIGKFPSHDLALNTAWIRLSLTAATLLACANCSPSTATWPARNPRRCVYRILHAAAWP